MFFHGVFSGFLNASYAVHFEVCSVVYFSKSFGTESLRSLFCLISLLFSYTSFCKLSCLF